MNKFLTRSLNVLCADPIKIVLLCSALAACGGGSDGASSADMQVADGSTAGLANDPGGVAPMATGAGTFSALVLSAHQD